MAPHIEPIANLKTIYINSDEIADISLRNAKILAEQYPLSFHRPANIGAYESIPHLLIGTYVKVCDGMERFWCKVDDYDYDEVRYICTINNDLTAEQSYTMGSRIYVLHDNIYDISVSHLHTSEEENWL